MSSARYFAHHLLRELTERDPRAAHLESRPRGQQLVVGMHEGETWVPFLRFSHPSASFNVMNLDIRQGDGWAPTGERGTPAALATLLTGALAFTWTIELEAILAWRETSEAGH